MIHRRLALALAAALLLLPAAPFAGQAHSPATQSPTFTPAPAALPFEAVLGECVHRTDPSTTILRPGLGDVQYPLVTLGPAADQTRAFYSQGMVIQYGFNFPEAIHAFHKAISLDEGAAMPYWGIALAASSNINSDATNGCNRLAHRAAQVALANAQRRLADPAARAQFSAEQLQREVDYATAMGALYRPVGPDQVTVGDDTKRAYTQAMATLAATYLDDLDAATLYAAALLNVTPWEWWYGNINTSDRVQPTPEAEEALQVLTRVLTRDELHAGADHFFIHAIEESPFSASGLPMAHRFHTLVPASGHLVHMSSHIQQRIGDNALASEINARAIAVDRAYAAQNPAADTYPLHYLGHNIHFRTWTLSIEGRRDETLQMADELIANTVQYATDAYVCTHYPEEITTKADYFFAVPFYFATRFEAWDYLDAVEPRLAQGLQAINQACITATQDTARPWRPLVNDYTAAMQAYANAYRRLSAAPVTSAAAIDALVPFWAVVETRLDANLRLEYGNNAAVDLLRMANLILVNRAQQSVPGTLAWPDLQRAAATQLTGSAAQPLADDLQALGGPDPERGIAVWQRAVALQDALAYNEPPDWYYTLRESLGYAYLAQQRYGDAERVFLEDLADNRLSGRSLFGLIQALEHQPGKPVSPMLRQQFSDAWRHATVGPQP